MTRWSPVLPASILAVFLCAAVFPTSAAADQRFIVRTDPALDGPQTIKAVCGAIGCQVRYAIDGRLGKVFVVTTPDGVDPVAFVGLIASMGGIRNAEIDGVARTQTAEAGAVPPALLDTEPIPYFGVTVRRGYVEQPANTIIGISSAYSRYKLTGQDITVAVIDTGVDPEHPVLAGVLTPGYDFTRDTEGGSELSDLNQSTIAVLDQSTIAVLDQSTIAVLDQSTIAVLDSPEYAAFGHGTMAAGIVHLVAPQAKIMPLKAFKADGTGYTSDILRAIYHAVDTGAKVINMSFEFGTRSEEFQEAIAYAYAKRVISVASTGNDGQRVVVYPAGYKHVVGVASTTNFDTISAFSNFGPEVAYIGAPGEGIVTTYPFGGYAAVWGTSFSAPFGAGTAALLADQENRITARRTVKALGDAVWISHDIKEGRLDINAAIGALNND
ncbi:MAG: S8 family serine peptidase [Acidobacteria bacterium]|nr:S8 family serine peptidase [Acidobacteriota bacterium]